MIGKLKQLKWTEKPETSRDLVFIVLILSFGIILVAKLAPYFRDGSKSVAYNSVQTIPTTPKDFLDRLMGPKEKGETTKSFGSSSRSTLSAQGTHSERSVIERPLFDGQAVILKVRSLNAFTSNDPNQPLEVIVEGAMARQSEGEIDYSPSDGAKVVGKGEANLSTRRLYLNFAELIARDGRTYRIQGQAVDPESLSAGVRGDYSSGLPSRLLGIAIDRAINVGDEVGMAHVFSATGPDGPGGQDFKKAAMETNQQASQNIAAEASKDLRETSAEISLPANSEFFVRVRQVQPQGNQP